MTITAARAQQTARPSTSEALVRLGMPHLAHAGLSETWLLKDLGDRHWQLIAEAAGLERPDFRDVDGARIYAAFCGTSIAEARFERLGEHDDLLISSSVARVSATQYASRHDLSCRGEPVGSVSLSSVFVRRMRSGQNRGLVRVAPEILARLPVQRDFTPITALASRVRSGTWHSHFGFSATSAETQAQQVFHPCPAQDFNGAGFLYFPSFPAFVDRAEWMLFRISGLTTLARDVIYHGNIEVGDTLTVTVRGYRETQRGHASWCTLVAADRRRLADVFTRKKRAGSPEFTSETDRPE